ncbi:MAG: hypothetical protein HY235_28255 [Acidobacteria bacterium]|nr:hypothetical protein [Acidobacteriota bacterium]
MSVDLNSNPAAAAALAQIHASPRHLIVFYGGFSDQDAHGGPLTTGYRTQEGRWENRSASRAFFGIRELRPGIAYSAFNPCLDNSTQNAAVQAGLAAIRAAFDPRGRLIVYGYSAGGYNALNLCRRIQSECGWYNVSSGLGNGAARGQYDVKVVIDLLITVDACLQRIHVTRADPAPPIVQQHANFYQRSDPEFQGISMEGARPNQIMPESRHNTICINTLPQVQAAIRKALDIPVSSHARVAASAPALAIPIGVLPGPASRR